MRDIDGPRRSSTGSPIIVVPRLNLKFEFMGRQGKARVCTRRNVMLRYLRGAVVYKGSCVDTERPFPTDNSNERAT
ncbi:hypothetical protein BV25DRAFT_335436 [Artomyces pyxidatus]|uniref:Uncharacterized protein n=1 Tax=Artomyces pyxidatus TaxID=48021 RepID=A0ACB8T7D0_9AGAM|nr:hypothetical protein BV25DRAFT_335436 [Artomyces pyxidatus]